MSSAAASRRVDFSPFEQLRYAREIIAHEALALSDLGRRLGTEFCRAVDLFTSCRHSVIVSGMGKAGLVGQKLMATLASTGTRAHFLHPAEALHGDLGRVHPDDVALILSQSGETEEIVRILPTLTRWGVPIVAITGNPGSALARGATVVLETGASQEACSLGLAPSTTTTAMLALGDALALVTSRVRGFGREDFAIFHPGGSLGRQLSHVQDQMRPLEQCRIADKHETVRSVFVEHSLPGRRTGAIMLVDATGRLCGLFTDSDLARLLESHRESALDRPIEDVMTRSPCTITLGARLLDAVSLMAQRKLSELPVVDAGGAPAGLLDITDLVSLLPQDETAAPRQAAG